MDFLLSYLVWWMVGFLLFVFFYSSARQVQHLPSQPVVFFLASYIQSFLKNFSPLQSFCSLVSAGDKVTHTEI